MVNCAVFGCNNESRRKTDSGENTKKLSFFSVPNVVRWQCSQTLEISTKRRAEWFRRLYRGDINTDATHYKVCSEHFVSGRPSYLMDLTNPDWAPSLHLGYDTKSTTRSEERHQRRCKRAATPKVVQKADSRVLRPLTTMLNAQQSAVNSTVTSTPLASPIAVQNDQGNESHMSHCTINDSGPTMLQQVPAATVPQDADTAADIFHPPSMPSPEVGRAPVSAETGSTAGAAVDGASYVKFSEAGVQATTSTAEASVNTTSLLKDAETQTDITSSALNSFEGDNQALRAELNEVKGSLRRLQLSKASLEQDDNRVKFYTGLPSYTVLIALFALLESGVSHSANNVLTKFEELVLTLVRLRLGVPLQDLAYRFEVSQATATRVVNRWIAAMHVRLKQLVDWPSREQLQQTMPMAFRKAFGTSVAVIIDCFEIFIERPSSMLPRSQTWSRYKHHNTAKYLIGIAPQGAITFISKGWGGRTSDKLITESSGMLNHLLPGDTVLADRGFTIGDAVGIHRARLEVPAFTRGKPQLSAWEVEKTRKIANVRIHVERVIGLLRRKYKILSSTIPIDLLAVQSEDTLTQLDKIVAVCAALTNLSKSVVPVD
ncbi:uncharacterized protein LOC119466118 isoform X2 [Dermacentor silvarum]|uniref:uncharacterized protein LOC119437063 isoform X2 n=1 Tax=Dermacentor silvarum TaxID=543639 RepID=UPI00189975C4|nr:uncharacterized protein LOC119437063 isoform X2 [Dermacentor silvarum]XP_037562076.1 uncharacterized protein LOC119441535 isoform X2 [Dermacentor silvarum]XP_037565648.1 uncharacterized protein LOC119445434 isoform X2 [Dermacentor silvarum]XP_037578590.1 uncharacterized protein LOC119461371 isoform X2 [Dermacentor silvarum]XP_037578787.1 uncharacterized protein LOC119461521 isoform X2 [Dermacentor silvarum]XP_037581834.1 uncharacterized protein LOC119465105 isoform X2 [Dermacentor silvarum]